MITKISLLFFCLFFLLSCTHDEYLSCSPGLKDNKGGWRFSCYESISLKSLDSNQDGKLTSKEIHFSSDTILEENKKYLLPTNDGLVMLNEFSKCDKTWGNFDTNKDGASKATRQGPLASALIVPVQTPDTDCAPNVICPPLTVGL